MSDIRKQKALHAHATVCDAPSGCGALENKITVANNASALGSTADRLHYSAD
jgi:hypothetical protein